MPMIHDVLLVGAHGFGAVHLQGLEALGPRVRLVALADPAGGPIEGFGSQAPTFPTLDAALAAGVRPDIVIIATPTGTHHALALSALDAGCDVFLEKPPVASMAQFESLLAAQQRSGRAVQVGFQSFGSHALGVLAALGRPTSVATWALWSRDTAYWARSGWAGRRAVDGAPIVDGVVTNPLAHAIATALRIAGARRRDDVRHVELELYRANEIEADDTSSVRITLTDGRIVSAALTLASPVQSPPLIEVRTADADVEFSYTEDVLRYPDGRVQHTGRTDLLVELLEHREHGSPLSAALEDTGAFMTVLEAVRTARDPSPIPEDRLDVITGGSAPLVTVREIGPWIERTARSGALFSELRAPFARPSQRGALYGVTLGDVTVATRDDGSTVAASSGPRPFLHPVRTRGGVVVTDAHPSDHDWHLGVSIAVQHADGVNFWGGRTYTAEHGYRWLDDHGRIRTTELVPADDGFTAHADWVAPSGGLVLAERTRWRFALSSDPRVWTFETETMLTAASSAVELGSPGTHGRAGGGYGGFAWRFPAVTDVDVRTPQARGEEAVHGRAADWLAFSGLFPGGEATVAVTAADRRARTDPWFVRVAAYPGIGSALAWADPIRMAPGESVTISFRGLVADGRLTDAEIEAMLG